MMISLYAREATHTVAGLRAATGVVERLPWPAPASSQSPPATTQPQSGHYISILIIDPFAMFAKYNLNMSDFIDFNTAINKHS